MEKGEYKKIFEEESQHFFYLANHLLVLSIIKKYLPKTNLNILDTGCGTGLLAKKMEKFGKVKGVDISREALKFARSRGIKVKKASISKLPFKNNNFDLVTSIDVLYHLKVKNDLKALKEVWRILKPKGILIIRVPANHYLYRSCDRQVHTRQRYSKEELEKKLIKTGFKIERISYINAILLPAAIFQWTFEKVSFNNQKSSPLISLPKKINRFITNILLVENRIFGFFDLPFGLGIIAVCRKIT